MPPLPSLPRPSAARRGLARQHLAEELGRAAEPDEFAQVRGGQLHALAGLFERGGDARQQRERPPRVGRGLLAQPARKVFDFDPFNDYLTASFADYFNAPRLLQLPPVRPAALQVAR